MIIYILTSFFIIEGLGLILPRQFNLYLYYAVPILFFTYQLVTKKTLKIPIVATIFYGLFLLFSYMSTFISSVDKQNSFELTLFYTVGYLIFLFFYNNKQLGLKLIRIMIFAGSLIFTSLYLINLLLGKNPITEFQLVLPYFNNGHNLLGDFLGLTLISFVYYILSNKKEILWRLLVVFFPFFLFSFSRSAYLAFFITSVFILIRSKTNKLLSLKTVIVLIGIIISLFFFFTTVQEAKNSQFFSQSYSWLVKIFKLKDKNFSASRPTYLAQGWQSFLQKPFFGVGAGNFGYISKKYQQNTADWTDTAHSLFPEILFENGGLALTCFLLFLLIILFKAIKNNHWEGYLFIYLLLNFQIDYSYRVYLMFILLLILAALNWEEKSKDFTLLYQSASVVILLILELILASNIFLNSDHPGLSLATYPLNKEAYKLEIIYKMKLGCDFSNKYASVLYNISPGDLSTLQFLSSYYKSCGNKKIAVQLLDEAYKSNKFISFDIVKEDYLLRKQVYGVKSASDFLRMALRDYGDLRQNSFFTNQVYDFCIQNGDLACQEENFGGWKYFYEPDPKNHEKHLKQVPLPENYTINKDTLNDRFDYTVEKPKNIFRIIVLGSSETFGLLVPTKYNWTERLEDLLNQNIKDPKIKKIEVINLAVDDYDIPYEVTRFQKRGLKYNPDLVLWFTDSNNYYQLNEMMSKKYESYIEKIRKTNYLLKNLPIEKYYRVYDQAYNDILNQVGKDNLFSIVEAYLVTFRRDYSGPLIIMSPYLSDKIKSMLNNVLGSKKTYFKLISLNNTQYYFPMFRQINEKGHFYISQEILNYLVFNNLIHK